MVVGEVIPRGLENMLKLHIIAILACRFVKLLNNELTESSQYYPVNIVESLA